jgi:protein sidekick
MGGCRYYTVQYRGDSSGPWQTVNERVEPTVTSYTVHALKPFTAYQFRIQVNLFNYVNFHNLKCIYVL